MFIAACCKRKTRLEQPKYLSIGYWLYKWRVPHFCWEIQFSSLRACSLCGYRQGFHTAQQQRRIYGAVCVVWSYLGANWCISVLYIRMGVLLAVLDSRVVGLWGVLLSLCSWNIFVTIMCDQTKSILTILLFLKKEYTGRKCTKIAIAALRNERALAFFLLFGIFHIFFHWECVTFIIKNQRLKRG